MLLNASCGDIRKSLKSLNEEKENIVNHATDGLLLTIDLFTWILTLNSDKLNLRDVVHNVDICSQWTNSDTNKSSYVAKLKNGDFNHFIYNQTWAEQMESDDEA